MKPTLPLHVLPPSPFPSPLNNYISIIAKQKPVYLRLIVNSPQNLASDCCLVSLNFAVKHQRPPHNTRHINSQIEAFDPRSTSVVKTFSNLLNSVHHPFAGARCSADSGGASDSIETQ